MPDGIERADLMAGLNLQNTISTGRNYRGPFDWVAEVGPFEPTEMSNGAGEWWLDSRRRQVRQGYGPHVRTLSERLHAFDLARQTGDLTESSQISIPEDQAGRLAERQKFLQAMASFRGSSGMYVPKRFGEPDKSGNEEFGAGSSWLHAGRRGAALR